MNDFFRNYRGEPVYVVGVQVHNSSVGTELMDKALCAAGHYGANTLEAPVYWNWVEPEYGHYVLDSARKLIDQARGAGLYLILLWFGAGKNGHPTYAPEYIKQNPETYTLATGPDGAAVASLSPHCAATRERDRLAFESLMRFLKEYDAGRRTVLAVQIENEMGYANTDRDYGQAAWTDYEKGPEAQLLAEIPPAKDGDGSKTWTGHFGRMGNETFSAWQHARYIDSLAAAGKAIYDLPLFTNVMVRENGMEEAGIHYNGGSPVAHMLEVWKLGAPHLDLICPDIYNEPKGEFVRVIDAYAREDNALFVPESPYGGEANAMNCLLAVEKGAIGYASFGIESALHHDGALRDFARPVAISYRAIAALAPLLIAHRGSGNVHAFVQDEFSTHQYLRLADYHVDVQFIRSHPTMPGLGSFTDLRLEENRWMLQERGRALLVQAQPHEFYLAGSGISAYFVRRPQAADDRYFAKLCSRQNSQLNFLTVEEGHFEGADWVVDRYRNGDESNFGVYAHNGQAVRIQLNPQG